MKKLTKTHISHLLKVQNALKMRQKINKDYTQLILTQQNQDKVDKAARLIGEAMAILNEIN